MDIETREIGKSLGPNPFEQMAAFLDRQVALAVLGQTGVTEPTPGALGHQNAQHEVRMDIRNADARQIQKTLNRDLIRPFIDLNFGPQNGYPQITLQTSEREDRTALASSLAQLVPIGLKVDQKTVRDRLNLPDPAPEAELLGGSMNHRSPEAAFNKGV